MADSLDLYADDFDKIIKTCAGFRMAIQIKELIDQRVRKYVKDNPNMIRDILVRVETLYPDDVANPDYVDGFYQEDVLNFNEEYPDLRNAPIVWLESYLFNIDTCSTYLGEISPNNTQEKYSTGRLINSAKTFESGFNKLALGKLYHFLIENDYAGRSSEENFVSIFSGTDRNNEKLKPIIWKVGYKNGTHMVALFELLKRLSEWEYMNVKRTRTFIEKVVDFFLDKNGERMTVQNVESRFNKWDKSGYTEKTMTNGNYNDPVNKILDFLYNKFP